MKKKLFPRQSLKKSTFCAKFSDSIVFLLDISPIVKFLKQKVNPSTSFTWKYCLIHLKTVNKPKNLIKTILLPSQHNIILFYHFLFNVFCNSWLTISCQRLKLCYWDLICSVKRLYKLLKFIRNKLHFNDGIISSFLKKNI